jgi:hypothetical protein
MLDRVGDNGEVALGLWNALSTIIGAGSFDSANKATCWGTFHTSDSISASDHVNGDHVRTLHDTILVVFVFDDLDSAGIPFKGGLGKYTKKTFSTTAFTRT